jgi:hypothetical protein
MYEDLKLQDNQVFQSLDAKFNTSTTALPVVQTEPQVTVEDDFDQARAALKRMIVKGETVLDDMMNVARQSDHPRAYEVAGQLIKTVGETAKDLLALQKTRRELQPAEEQKAQQIGTQNNIVFAGSTTDLLRALKQKNETVIDAIPTEKTQL